LGFAQFVANLGFEKGKLLPKQILGVVEYAPREPRQDVDLPQPARRREPLREDVQAPRWYIADGAGDADA
jgi:hypothetical protein